MNEVRPRFAHSVPPLTTPGANRPSAALPPNAVTEQFTPTQAGEAPWLKKPAIEQNRAAAPATQGQKRGLTTGKTVALVAGGLAVGAAVTGGYCWPRSQPRPSRCKKAVK